MKPYWNIVVEKIVINRGLDGIYFRADNNSANHNIYALPGISSDMCTTQCMALLSHNSGLLYLGRTSKEDLESFFLR